MSSEQLIKAGAAAGAAYLGFKYLDEKHSMTSDFKMARRLLKFKGEVLENFKNGYNVSQMWYDVLKKNPKKVSMIYEDERVTYAEVEKRSNQLSNWLLAKGLKRGDTVALLMENKPEFVISWLGMTKIGVKVALINTAIKQNALVHCVKISSAKMLFFGTELAENVGNVLPALSGELGLMVYGWACSGSPTVDFCEMAADELAASPVTAVSPKLREGIVMSDVFGYIYTSGTTGLPKAAVILHQKFFAFGALMANCFLVRDTDVIYTCLPLFHSAGGGLGIGVMLYTGCTVVVKRKFSATDFWADCTKHKVTVVQYIGELCRYLLQQAPRAEEKTHRVRMAIGNGLRPEIWADFQDRFGIPEIGEFYGSTEGNGALVNHCTDPTDRGAVGRLGTILMKIMGLRLVKFDVLEEEAIRGADSFCSDCDADEAGELLFVIKDDDQSTTFAGYNDKKATEKKIIRDVFVKGDKYFRTGDLLKRDARGYFYFVDRIGDTFRWKGENCSTSDIAQELSVFPGIDDLNVYGVLVPNNQDGRAPMASLTPQDGDLANVDLEGFARHAEKNLPRYAIPLFLRIQPQMAVTATMKHQKVQLRNEGMDIAVVKDPIYWYSPESKTYVPLTAEHYATVTSPKARL